MGFLAPWNLWALLGLVALGVLYWRWRQGRSSGHVWYPGIGPMAGTNQQNIWFYLPLIGFFLALAAALLATARPTLRLMMPENLAGVILAIENGWSMRQTDIAPNRMVATQMAAKALVDKLPRHIKVGVVTFSGYGTLLLPPTTDRKAIRQAIDNLDLGGGFSFTYGLLAALEALPQTPPEGSRPGVIVLFSHGHDVSGNDPLKIADQALERGIQVHAIGVGTHGHNFDEEMLKKVADRTGGRYYPIFSASDLSKAHADLGRVLAWRPQTTEVSGLLSLLAALLLGFSLGLSAWRRRVI
ncbi:vWA domain-containing protein [Meiothermus ruber]|jgi:Ca-activated chloride channel family protein|uniref:von Willebrand factor type A n=1 Tax=Meiothermus ruber (strain ATCC 35948 / DSM 1279 / VKM B-1258 / 21) TaxID=504728 RepID=D3PRJ6_MEIRD|nr:VWA domain-containing protein [Meiothermus ruber]ADD28079.1 von Willebrand factor type A [Meiothermus ruber DSM 1279]AGK04548.1 von Willebrand factor type A [Meiothermus ruber DSM 1279]MCL6528790.1 VWA domain-containing protein [Meiothermus ruber]GAO75027.1 von Willebrand factor type [Meiothermus ruber H328]